MSTQQAPRTQRTPWSGNVNAVTGSLLSVSEAAQLLKVSTSTIWRWINRGELPAYRVGQRRIVLKASEVEQILRAVRQQDREEVSTMEGSQQQVTLAAADVTRLRAAMERAQALRTRILQEHGGQSLPSSTEVLREQRDQRSTEL